MPLPILTNEIQRMEGKAVWVWEDIIDAAEEGTRLLSEEQLNLPMHRFCPKLGVSSGEVVIVYIRFNGDGNGDGVQSTSPLLRYLIPELANDNVAATAEAAHPNDRDSTRTRLLSKLKGYVVLEVYSDYPRNPPYLKVNITRVCIWGGATARERVAGDRETLGRDRPRD
ncbi:MAG: hypothetical protein M1839_006351 [Geoglossum umbratile]|nr:MAG: hypothetical protein M1839_006351 [Geoglossum umbratile]